MYTSAQHRSHSEGWGNPCLVRIHARMGAIRKELPQVGRGFERASLASAHFAMADIVVSTPSLLKCWETTTTPDASDSSTRRGRHKKRRRLTPAPGGRRACALCPVRVAVAIKGYNARCTKYATRREPPAMEDCPSSESDNKQCRASDRHRKPSASALRRRWTAAPEGHQVLVEGRPNSARIGQVSLKSANIRLKSAKFSPDWTNKIGRNGQKLVEIGPNFVEFGQRLVEYRPTSVKAMSLSNHDQLWPKAANLGRNRPLHGRVGLEHMVGDPPPDQQDMHLRTLG